MKKIIIGIILTALLLSLGVCAFAETAPQSPAGAKFNIGETAALPEKTAAIYENEGMKLLIPAEYDALLVTETPENADDGTLFLVSEKASVEAAKGERGAGFLFGITHDSEENVRRMRCSDMSGAVVFAQAEDGSFYVFRHPTDVRFARESYDNVEEDLKQWTELNSWAWDTVPASFVEENEGLTAVHFGNTDLDIFLARIAFADGVDYTLSTTEYGPMEPGDTDPSPFLERLMNGVSYEPADLDEAPDGEYVVLRFPEEDYRFDFFLAEGGENVIRQVWAEDNEMFYRACFDDEARKASDVMKEWYSALVPAAADGSEVSGEAAWDTAVPTEVTKEVRAVFESAMEGLVGVDYVPVAVLARRENTWCILCRATAVYPEARPYNALVYIDYEDGKASVRNVYELWIDAHSEKTVREEETDYGESSLFSKEEMDAAAALIRAEFDRWEGCEMHSLRYAGDEACTEENLAWMNSLKEGSRFTRCIEFVSDFHSPAEGGGAWAPDEEYTDWQWWLAGTEDGDWVLVTWGY